MTAACGVILLYCTNTVAKRVRKYLWPDQIGYHLATIVVIIWGNYNIKYLSIINCVCEFIIPHRNSRNISSVSIKKGYKINIEHDIEKLKVASEREFMWVL